MARARQTTVAVLLAALTAAIPTPGWAAAPGHIPPPPPPPVRESPPPTPTRQRDEPAPVDDEVESVFDLGLEGEVPPPPEESNPGPEPASLSVSAQVQPNPTERTPASTPEDQPARKTRTPPTQVGVAGWSLLLGAFAVGAGASTFVGFSERERVRARRIGVAYDLFTDMPRALPEDIEGILAKSRASRRLYLRVATGLGAGAGAMLLTSVALLVADTVKRKRTPARTARVRVRGLSVQF